MKRVLTAILSLIILMPSAAVASGGQLFVTPASGVYTVGKPFTVLVQADTAGQSVSAVEGELAYNPLDFTIVSVSIDHSILSSWATAPSYDGATGIISFSGWAKNNYTGKNGLLVSVTLLPLRSVGQSTLHFNSGAMLASDGKGSNIITSMTSGVYSTQPKEIEPVAPVILPASSTPATPEVPPAPTSTLSAATIVDSANAAALPFAAATSSGVVLFLSESLYLFGPYIIFFGLLAFIAFLVAYYFHRKKIAF